MASYMCLLCGYIYNEALGDLEHGVSPTPWANLEDSWCCPDCGAIKSKFEITEDDLL